MKQAIVIGTYRGSPWLQRCIDSIPSNIPVMVVRAEPYECGALRWVMENTALDRWLFLQDSTAVRDPSWIYANWDHDTSVTLNCEPGPYGSFMGWWRRSVLAQCQIPETPDKLSAVLAEMSLPKQYCAIESPLALWPEFTIQIAVPETMFADTHHERVAMRYENQFFTKWKSSWNGDTLFASDERDKINREINP